MLGQGFDSPLIHSAAKYRTILQPLASRFFQFNVRYIWDKGEPAIMLCFLIRHQTDVMLSLSCVCAMTAFLVFLTGSLEKSRKAALMIMEIGGMILLIFEMFSYVYRGDRSELGYWMVRIGNFMTFAMMPILIGGFTHYLSDLLRNDVGLKELPKRLKVIYVLVGISELLLIGNIFGKYYYVIDEQNTYHRSWGFMVCYVIPLIILVILLTVICRYYQMINKDIRISLLLFTIAPFAGSLIQFFIYGLSITDIFIVATCVMLYVFVLIDLNHAKEIKDRIEQKNREQMEIISTIANIYNSMYELNLEKNTFRELRAGYVSVDEAIEDKPMDLQQIINTMIRRTIDESCIDEDLLKSTDLETINDRMRDTDIWTKEVMNPEKKWRRGRIIVSKRDDTGKIARILWVTEDIDKERRERERLKDVSERAVAASEAKSAFLSNMSHEIRTPINAVLGMNEMILRESEDEDILTYASSIKTAGSTLLGLINDILDFSKIEAGKMEIIPVEYDLSSIINDLVNMSRTKADDKGLELKLDIDKDTPHFLYGDEVRIKQIVTNILTNAVKYTEKGIVTFAVSFERPETDDGTILLKISVKDTGIGIKEEDMSKLFSKFDRIEEKRNRNVEGTGLGMSITQKLLEMMDSSLEVESVYGEGSDFHFAIRQKVIKWDPIGDYEASYRAALAARTKYREKFTAPEADILVVDDNNTNLAVFRNLLKRTKVRIDTASSGEECLKMSGKKKYDIVFLDHMMPDKDGIETLHEMREMPDDPNGDTVAVCLTANAISGAKEKYLSAGFDDYLTKPIDADKLEEMLIRYLPEEKVVLSESDREPHGEEKPLPEWLLHCVGIDPGQGVVNCGGTEEYLSVLEGFHSTVSDRADEIEAYYDNGDLKNYTIKVHALKSAARVVGAMELSEKARLLEEAGNENNAEYIKANTAELLSLYRSYEDILSAVSEGSSDRPDISAEMLADAYEGLAEFAQMQDYELARMVVRSLKEYRLPEPDDERFKRINSRLAQLDWEGIREILKEWDRS